VEFFDRQGAGSLSWVPRWIVFGWFGDLMDKFYFYAPLVGALAGAICGLLVIRLRRRASDAP
jgi:glycerol uptake facilitator-like aquaporin